MELYEDIKTVSRAISSIESLISDIENGQVWLDVGVISEQLEAIAGRLKRMTVLEYADD